MDQNVPESDGKYIILERFMLHHWIIFYSGATDNLQLTALSHLTDLMNTRPGREYLFVFKKLIPEKSLFLEIMARPFQ